MTGKVSLLGAGPGNPELLTVLGQRRLKEADVVFFDRLVNPSILALVNATAELVDVGKLPKFHKVRQSKINELLVGYAQAGKQVVRLKAGDPYVFGRGGEEAQILRKAGVPFEVIPGITSAIAGLAAAGIPITHRDFASSFHVITGHHQKDGRQIDWENVAHQEGTLVFLMGMAALDEICAELVSHGKDVQTPVAIIQWATQWRQKQVVGTLGNISQLVRENQLGAPALIVVGDVVKLQRELKPSLPLMGRHLLVPISKTKRLFHALQDQGATADFYPRAQLSPTGIEIPKLTDYQAIAFDSISAFRTFTWQLTQTGQDLRKLVGLTILVPNQMIATHIKALGIIPSVASEYDGKLLELGIDKQLFTNSDFVPLFDAKMGATWFQQTLADFDGIIFPSTASVSDFQSVLSEQQQEEMPKLIVFAMGATVAEAAKLAGFEQVIECPTKTIQTIAKVREVLTNE
ncbi:uroporphyrinogen-III C-methyltransferase [Lactobacillus sp. 3B(2020)]|uniref:uroporphyrinogen-III C-methyltransferase n=1 Tax=Lactobacillus sp. 3B(2020) TaxID=2695882 RepID=UPI0015DEA3C2|nr:uroporphyrinogen-III C-methyltransferase [Lactobacillus sp. 3B(2020)]QLL69177.1 uroporphyrinogen-III C-methyltransferase [Lactobacillus sp. 3B(2020)]